MNSDLSLWLQAKAGEALGYLGGIFVVSVIIVLLTWSIYRITGRQLNYRRALAWVMAAVAIGAAIGRMARAK